MSGLSRTPGKRVWGNTPPRVRIPPSPPVYRTPKIPLVNDENGLAAAPAGTGGAIAELACLANESTLDGKRSCLTGARFSGQNLRRIGSHPASQ
jgi:hypothetical protein